MRDPFDLVRDWFAVLNRGDLGALEDYYAEQAAFEQDGDKAEGRAGIVGAWTRRFSAWGPGFAGGGRRRLHMVGLVETGVVHAEWLEREADGMGGERERRGYSQFRIEHGHIVWQQDVALDDTTGIAEGLVVSGATTLPPRRYPPRPVVGVGGVIVDDQRVVLIKRKYEPLAGQWSLPGGTLELGESLEAGVAREVFEETGLDVVVGPVVEVFDRILLDAASRVQYHFVLVDYLCRPVGGTLRAGSDVDDAVWAIVGDLARYQITAKATAIVHRAVAMAADAVE
jgi:ADP-ribose pyrophosphatase YjhB (NUDIX family)/ketosteroid isomerase-like protein